jgi:hypothetical protein
MDLSKILSISGKPGLYMVVSQMKNAVLVESLIDKKRFPAFAHEKISSLQEISIFTDGEDRPLKEVLKAIHEKQEGKVIAQAGGDNKALLGYFIEVVPDYDREKVYVSDIKKVLNWYNLLLENDLLDFSEKEEETPQESVAEEGGEANAELKEKTEKKKKAPVRKTDNAAKQAKPATMKAVKKSDHRSMNSK